VIVEGYPDAMYLPTLGLNNVVAVGQGLLSKSHIQGLQAFKVKRVILSFDNDPPKEDGTITGVENTEKALDLLKDTGIRAFVVDPPLLSPQKDPDEFVRDKGIERYKALVDVPHTGGMWLAERWAKQYDLSRDIDKKKYIEKALEYDAGIPEAQATDGEDLLKTVVQATGYDLESLLAERKGIREKKAKEKLEKGYRDLFKEGERLLYEGKVDDISPLLDERYKALRGARAITRNPFYQYESLKNDLSTTIPGLETGFKNLDQFIRIPQEALTIVAARPSHGKTTFLMNLMINLIHHYPDKHFFFFSYEETRKKLAVKLITILAGVVVAEDRKGFNVGQVENYIRGDNRGMPRLNDGIEKYESLVASQRLGLMDEHLNIDELTDYIASLTEKYDTGAVLIDYIQKVKNKRHYQTRQLELQDITRLLLETSLTCKVPIVLGAQFNREVTAREGQQGMDEGKLREAGDIEQDANLVLGLWCEAKSQEEKERDGYAMRYTAREVDLDVLVLKNRDGEANRKVTLSFDRPVLRLKDKDKT
jgi:replicative DNA helicase